MKSPDNRNRKGAAAGRDDCAHFLWPAAGCFWVGQAARQYLKSRDTRAVPGWPSAREKAGG
jgi:hypothetical protein